jgi:four helix bundle protein
MIVENEKLRFEGLKVYERALEFIDMVFECTKSLPEIEEKILSLEFRNSSIAIALYIAEGSGKNRLDFISDLKYAKDAIRRCLVFTTIAKRRNYINEIKEEELRIKVLEISKMLSGFIASLHNRKGNNRVRPGYHPDVSGEIGHEIQSDLSTDFHADAEGEFSQNLEL